MTPHDYDYLRAMLKERSGLMLAGEKQYLLESRLAPIARKRGLGCLGELVVELKAPNAEMLIAEVVEAMTTNESFFFRDKTPFEQFRDTVLPQLLAARRHTKRVRIWCAASSAGQEPYSLAMTLKEMPDLTCDARIEILATDISTEILAKAKSGLYTQFEVQRGLPIQYLVKYFAKVGDMWQIAPELRAMVQFRPLNLMRDFSNLGVFDLVFCRNVLIYFDPPTKINVLSRIADVTAPDGYLCLGAAETVVGLTDEFRALPDRRGFYAPNRAAVVSFEALRAAVR